MKGIIFDYSSYKDYIKERLLKMPSRGRGMKLKMSEALSCQTAFVSQVLNGAPHFSLEQAIKLNRFFEHTKEESQFFLLLLQKDRAGSKELSDYFLEEINDKLAKRTDLKHRLDIKNSLKAQDREIYYSSWLYACLHMIVSIPEFRTAMAIAKHLHIPREKIEEVLEFLNTTGLIQKKGLQYEIGQTKIHLPKDSPQIQRHHTHWRMKAVSAIDLNLPDNLHYSSIVSMAENDVPKVREIMIKAIEECRGVIKDSKEEKLQSICIDFFSV